MSLCVCVCKKVWKYVYACACTIYDMIYDPLIYFMALCLCVFRGSSHHPLSCELYVVWVWLGVLWLISVSEVFDTLMSDRKTFQVWLCVCSRGSPQAPSIVSRLSCVCVWCVVCDVANLCFWGDCHLHFRKGEKLQTMFVGVDDSQVVNKAKWLIAHTHQTVLWSRIVMWRVSVSLSVF